MQNKTVKDLMVDLFEFPHIHSWFSIRQAIEVIKKSVLESEKCIRPIVMLVFDEKYNFVGTLTHINILKGLEPTFLHPTIKAQVPEKSEVELSLIWDMLFSTESRALAEKTVSDIMIPVKMFVSQDDPITKAAYLMLHYDLILLPVLDAKKKIVGIVRLIEIFDELSDVILQGSGGE